MGLFGPSPPVSADEFEWLVACFAWLDRTLGERDRVDGFSPRLVHPNDADLLKSKNAREVFAVVKQRSGLEAWECRLEQGASRRAPLHTGLDTGPVVESSALGTFSIEGNTPVIRYDPALLQKPEALVATFAHELAHLVVHSLGSPPGGEALEEHATDLTAVYMGFGIFLANSARNFSQFSDGAMAGWRSESSGYLSENALVTALAIFEHRFSRGEDTEGLLKDYLGSPYRRADRYLTKRHPNLASELATISLDEWA